MNLEFSVICSTLSPEDLAAFAIKKYTLDSDTKCRLLKTGINHTYKLYNPQNSYILRVYSHDWRSRTEIEEELNLLLFLNQNKVSVSYPISDSSGDLIQSLKAPEGERHAVLFSYAPGHKVQNYNEDTHLQIGRLMASMHKLTEGRELQRTTYDSNVLLHQSLDRIREFLSDDSEEMQFLINTFPLLEKKLNNVDPKALRKGIVHLDLWFDNISVTDENQVTVFDFDFCGNGYLCLDLAYYIMQLHNTEKDETQRQQKIEAFYKGYESILSISPEEKQLIPTLGVCLYYFYLGTQCFRFNNWSNSFVNEVYLRRYIAVLIRGYYEKMLRE